MKKKQAFSLIELAIVVTIIGVLIVGIIGGTALIKTATITGARSFTVKAAVPQISGLVAWYETSLTQSLKPSESYDGAQISKWYDVSPNSLVGQEADRKNPLTKTASSAITYTADGINDLPSLKFSGTGTDSVADTAGKIVLSGFYQGTSAQNTIFVVFRTASLPSNTKIFIDSGDTSIVSVTGIAAANSLHFNLGTTSNTATSTNPASFTVGSDYILASYFNGSSSKAYLNDATNMVGGATVSPGSNPLTGLTVGSDRNGRYSFNGLISEIIIYNRALPIQERRDVFKYLSYKYNISVNGI